MTTQIQLDIARAILATGLVTKVYHSAQLIRDQDNGSKLYPVYHKGADFPYIGPDDTQGFFAYIRTNGDLSATVLKVSSCNRNYEVSAPMRVVFFHDNEDHDQQFLLTKLASFTFLTGVTLQRVIDDKFRLVREESDMYRERFDGKTFYAAFDVSVNVLLLQSECEATKACDVQANPLCI